MPNFFINVKEKGAKKAEKNIKGLNGALGGLASKAALAAGGFFGATMLLSGMKKAIDLAGQQEAAEKALETALGRRSQALLDQASALQTMSVFGDEAIIQQQAFLGSLKFSEDQIKSIIPAAMDLAAATGMTLESAVRNTAKTFSGLAGELGELVPQLRGLTKEQMMAGDAVKVMADLFGGQASSQAQTMAGQLQQLSNVAGDLAEDLGDVLAPAVMVVTSALTEIIEGTSAFLDWANGMDTVAEAQDRFVDGSDEIARLVAKYDLVGESSENLLENFLNTDSQLQVLLGTSYFYRQETELLREELEKVVEAYRFLAINSEAIIESQPRLTSASETYLKTLKKIKTAHNENAEAINDARIARENDLTSMVKGNNTLLGEMRSQIQGKFAVMIAGLLERIIGTTGFAGLALAPIAAAGASQLFNTLVPSFATGGDFVTNGEQLIRVGDNPSGRERVQITPLGGDPAPNTSSGSSVTVNVSGNVLSQDFVEGELAENIKEAVRRGTDFGIATS